MKPIGAGAVAAYAYLLGSGASQDRANRGMYSDACDVAKSQGQPAPDPKGFQRQGPKIHGEINWTEGKA